MCISALYVNNTQLLKAHKGRDRIVCVYVCDIHFCEEQ